MMPHRTRARLAIAAILIATTLTAPSPLRAQVDDEEDAPEAAAQPAQPQFHLDDSYLDQCVFGSVAQQGGGRAWFGQRMTMALNEVERSGPIGEAQREKLRLAARGDTKRFFDLMEEKRKRFQLVKDDQNKLNEFRQELRPLMTFVNNGPFGPGSILGKTIKTTLAADQAAALEEARRVRMQFRHRARLDLMVTMMGESLGLTDGQHRRLVDLLVAETKPTGRFGQYKQYEIYLFMYRAALLPEAKLRPIFDDAQWRSVSRSLGMAKGYENFLRTAGLLDRDDGDDPKPAEGKDAR